MSTPSVLFVCLGNICRSPLAEGAMRDAAARGHDVRGATAYVTLEPCAHQGRTGPCCGWTAA